MYNTLMTIEDSLPEKFRTAAFHPSLFIYAWKRSSLDKLFEELLASNIAILSGELWRAEGEEYFGVIPLSNGGKAVLSWKTKIEEGEDWYDFVERSIKEAANKISEANLEKQVRASIRNRLYYHFEFAQE